MRQSSQYTTFMLVLLLLSASFYSLLMIRQQYPNQSNHNDVASISLKKVVLLEGRWNQILHETNSLVASSIYLKSREVAHLKDNTPQIDLMLRLLAQDLPDILDFQYVSDYKRISTINVIQNNGQYFYLTMILPLTKELYNKFTILATFNLNFVQDIIETGHGIQLLAPNGQVVVNYNSHFFDPFHTSSIAVINKKGRIRLQKNSLQPEVLQKVLINNSAWYLRYVI